MSQRNSANALSPMSLKMALQLVVAPVVLRNSLALLVLVLLISNGGAG